MSNPETTNRELAKVANLTTLTADAALVGLGPEDDVPVGGVKSAVEPGPGMGAFAAAALNSSKVLSAAGGTLITATIPSLQCCAWPQNSQMGAVESISNGMTMLSEETNWKEVSIPNSPVTVFFCRVHGAEKGDCVMVWLPFMNWKFTTSPGCAVIVLGRIILAGCPLASTPTVTVMLAAETNAGIKARRAKMDTMIEMKLLNG